MSEDTGDCFEVAAHIAVLDNDEMEDLTLVHGLPVGRGEDNRGLRFWHAWVERGDTVIDRSNGNDVEMPRYLYYAIGNIYPANTYRYSPIEAAEEMLTHEHFGPWVEGWEEMEELSTEAQAEEEVA